MVRILEKYYRLREATAPTNETGGKSNIIQVHPEHAFYL